MFFVGAAAAAEPADRNAKPPNILVIVADDLGWSDLGAFGSEIATPNLDALARSGAMLTNFYTAPSCSPTRAMLLTGVDNHKVGLGTMAEEQTEATRGRAGYEGHLNTRAATIAERLRSRGYRTMMAGKWHLGLTSETGPAARGFDRSFALLQGDGNHFGADQNAAWAAVGGAVYREDGRPAIFPAGGYSTDIFAGRLMNYLEEGDMRQQPFFAYLAFTAPHWPLQAPAAAIAKYRGRYDEGPEALRRARLSRQKRLGLVSLDVSPRASGQGTLWREMTAEERSLESRKMEVYAAMVDRLDRAVGQVLDALRKSGQLRNTIIIFLSDNGPDALPLSGPLRAQDPSVRALLGIDNSLGNIGAATSYTGYGRGWAEASAAPSWLFKGYMSEGGIRAPAIVSGPGVAAGRRIDDILHVTDVAPSLLAASGAAGSAEDGRGDMLPFEGRDFMPLLSGQTRKKWQQRTLSWELFGGRAVREGPWKAVYLAPWQAKRAGLASGPGWRLFDLFHDPGETRDLAAKRPAMLARLVAASRRYALANGVLIESADVLRDDAVLRARGR